TTSRQPRKSSNCKTSIEAVFQRPKQVSTDDRMTLLYSDPLFLEHDTGRHPERADRLRAVTRQLERSGLDKRCDRATWKAATPADLSPIHDPAYIDRVRALADHGGGHIEADTAMSRRSYEVACHAAGAVND